MEISQNGINLLKKLEGCKLYAYDDMTGKKVGINCVCKGTLTIGIGHTGNDVFKGQVITEEQAENLLKIDIKKTENTINYCVEIDLTQNQFDSLCCFVFNIGCNAFKKSTMLKLLNKGRTQEASNCFKNWHRANGKPHVLDNRRKQECELFLKQ